MEEFSPVQTLAEGHFPQRMSELIPLIEALLFAAPEPMRVSQMAEVIGEGTSEDDVQAAVNELERVYDSRQGGFRLEGLGRLGYQFRTTTEVSHLMERLFAAHARPLSRSALETLSIIAYRQPCTRADVESIRGVDAGSSFQGLLAKGLITCVGRKEEIGRPMVFGTTDEFLKVFRIGHLRDLPSLHSFQPPPELLQGAALDTSEEMRVDVESLVSKGEFDIQPDSISDAFPESLPDAIVGAVAAEGEWGGEEEEKAMMVEEINDLQPYTDLDLGGETVESAATNLGSMVDQGADGLLGDNLPSEIEASHDRDAFTEMDSSAGTSVPPGSREVD